MRLLLDTHMLLWWLADDSRLKPKARALIENPENTVFVSVVSLWEIAVKVRIGKLEADIVEVVDTLGNGGFTVLNFGSLHLAALVTLQRSADHNDPFDHLLVAQAIVEGASLVSNDEKLRRYPITLVEASGRTRVR